MLAPDLDCPRCRKIRNAVDDSNAFLCQKSLSFKWLQYLDIFDLETQKEIGVVETIPLAELILPICLSCIESGKHMKTSNVFVSWWKSHPMCVVVEISREFSERTLLDGNFLNLAALHQFYILLDLLFPIFSVVKAFEDRRGL